MRLTKERVLKSLQEELNEKLHEKRVSKISRKYKMVKFFGEHVKQPYNHCKLDPLREKESV